MLRVRMVSDSAKGQDSSQYNAKSKFGQWYYKGQDAYTRWGTNFFKEVH
jgi:hypothetical protein